MSHRPTLREIGQIAGVSKTTVWLALRDHSSIPEVTRTRIKQIAHEKGYFPRALLSEAMAQMRAGTRGQFRSTIGIIVISHPTLERFQRENPALLNVIEGIRKEATSLGYATDFFLIGAPELTGKRLKQILHSRNIRGLVLIDNDHKPPNPEWSFLATDFSSVIVVESRPRWVNIPYISSDYSLAARLCAEQIALRGRHSVGCVLIASTDKEKWFRATLRDFFDQRPGMTLVPSLIMLPTDAASFRRWFRMHQPTCIITDVSQLRQYLADMSLRVPEDVGLIHLRRNNQADPGDWTGIDMNEEQLGAVATQGVVARLQRGEKGPLDIELGNIIACRWHEGKTLDQNCSYASCHHPGKAYKLPRSCTFEPIDLKKHPMRPFYGPNSWFGQEPLLYVPPGPIRIHGALFEIAEVESGLGGSIHLQSKQHSPDAQSQTAIRIQRRVHELYFLHACAFITSPCSHYADYEMLYSDGTKHTLPLIALGDASPAECPQANIQDWWRIGYHPLHAPYARALEISAFGDPSEYTAQLHTLRWENPYPQKPLESVYIRIRPEAQVVHALIAITACITPAETQTPPSP